MKILSVILKSLKEQIRSIWILLLTISMAPFFVFIYYLITETSKPQYDLLILNQDEGIEFLSKKINYGNFLIEAAKLVKKDSLAIPLNVQVMLDRPYAINLVKNNKADALVIIPENFSKTIQNIQEKKDTSTIAIEFIGDISNVNYMISAIWANEILDDYIWDTIKQKKPIIIKETALGSSSDVNDFDYYVPGLLILAIIMIMFSATIAIVNEVENKTILRLKLSKINSLELLSGISIVQVLVGLLSILSTLLIAVWLGFSYTSSLGFLLFIAVLTSISIISFSLILAAFTKTANEVLIVVNFPLLLFMFFTGAAFPINGKVLFNFADYPFTIQGLMSPTHAISALKKVVILGLSPYDVLPEIFALIILTIIYFLIGVWFFQKRHMKIE